MEDSDSVTVVRSAGACAGFDFGFFVLLWVFRRFIELQQQQ